MNFFGMGTPEILVVLLLAFLLLGPERMISAAKMLGKYAGEMRRMASEIPDLTLDGDERKYGESPIVHRGSGPNPSVRPRSEETPGGEASGDESAEAAPDDDGPVAFRRGRPPQDAPESTRESGHAMSESRLPFGEHVNELRKRLTRSVIAVVLCTGVAFVFHEQILVLLMEPAQGFAGIPNGKPVFINLTEFISTAMKASLVVGLCFSFPFVLYQMVMFIAPGLTPSERRYLYALMPAAVGAFALGAFFGYRVLFPPAIKFLLGFGSGVATPMISIGSYVGLMLTLLLWMGVVFEMPVVLFFLSRLGIVTPRFLARQRRYAIVLAFVLGAVITPTFDPINQALVALPIVALYEVSIWLSKLAHRGRERSRSKLGLADTDAGT